MDIIISRLWDVVRLFRYSGPVQGHFTSHDSGERPHICLYILRAYPEVNKMAWLVKKNLFEFIIPLEDAPARAVDHSAASQILTGRHTFSFGRTFIYF